MKLYQLYILYYISESPLFFKKKNLVVWLLRSSELQRDRAAYHAATRGGQTCVKCKIAACHVVKCISAVSASVHLDQNYGFLITTCRYGCINQIKSLYLHIIFNNQGRSSHSNNLIHSKSVSLGWLQPVVVWKWPKCCLTPCWTCCVVRLCCFALLLLCRSRRVHKVG